VTLLNVTEAQFTALNGSEFVTGGNGGGNNGNNGPVLTSMTLNVADGGTTVLTAADFVVTNPAGTDFYTVNNVTHGQFQVFQNGNWAEAQTGGFTDTQITDGDVRFVQDGTDAAPTFTIFVSDGNGNTSNGIAPTVNFSDAPVVILTAAAMSTTATVNFDGLDASSGGVDGLALSGYLAAFGITLSATGASADPAVSDDRQIYGGGIVNATTGHNVIGESGGFPVSYTVTFDHALTSFEFDRVQENAGPSGSSYPEWTATAYDAAGNVLSTVSEGENLVFGSSTAAAHYTLSGPNIDHVTFTGNDQGHDGFANVLTDNWVLNGTSAAPAASENTPLTITGIHVSDLAAGSNTIEVSLSVADGTLALSDSTGLQSVSFDANHDTVTVTGSATEIDTAISKGLVFTPATGFNGDETLTVTANDQGHNASGVAETTTQTLTIPVTNAVTGDANDNLLSSTTLNDTLTGGKGADQFIFNATASQTGHDIITDFAPGQDVIDLNYNSLPADTSNFSTWLSSHATTVNGDVLIDLNADGAHPSVDTILLKNVTLASLHANDFHFGTNNLA
jgi:hypothetical protein